MDSTVTWQIKIDPSLATPIWGQLVSEILRNISRFRPEPGTPVISARQLAENLSLHRNTVRQAYGELLSNEIFAYRNCRSLVIGSKARELFLQPFPTISLILQQKLADQLKESTLHGLETFGSIMDRASELGISVNVTALPPANAPSSEITNWIEETLMRSIGIINFGPRNTAAADPVFEHLTKLQGIIQVFAAGYPADSEESFSWVSEDQEPGFHALLSELKKNGHRKLAIFSWHKPSVSFRAVSASRANTLYRLAPEYGISSSLITITPSGNIPDVDEAHFRTKIDELLSLPEVPTAIWAQNDQTAMLIRKILEEKSLSIPGDISLIGFDNDTGGFLASVSYSRAELGKALVDSIWKLYRHGKNSSVIRRGIATKFYPNQTIGKAKNISMRQFQK